MAARLPIRTGTYWSLAVCVLFTACHAGGEQPRENTDTLAHAAWTVSARSAGPLDIGMTFARAEEALGVDLGDGAGAACEFRRVPGPHDGLLLMFVDGVLARVDVRNGSLPTAEGVGVGSPESRVQQQYAGRVTVLPRKYETGHTLEVATDGQHRLVFETDGAQVVSYRGGRLPEATWVEGCS